MCCAPGAALQVTQQYDEMLAEMEAKKGHHQRTKEALAALEAAHDELKVREGVARPKLISILMISEYST